MNWTLNQGYKSEPVFLHFRQEPRGERISGLVADHRVEATLWAERRLTDAFHPILPAYDLAGAENLAAMETTAALAGEEFVSVVV
jgi:hypothetical protein